jgi:hypothetical protein
MTNEYRIAVLLPTRGRTDALERSVKSIVNRAVDPSSIQLLLAFDEDDAVGTEFFVKELQPWLYEKGIAYSAKLFKSLGYEGLNVYYNSLAQEASADWFFVWNDDSMMETAGWDRIITKRTGQFKIFKIHTHNEHPYSIFPIIPKEWFDTLGYFSRHQMIDAEVSQVAYLLDLIEIVDIYATHDRADLTGNNKDETDAKRVRYEGNPQHPLDFHNPAFGKQRLDDAERLVKYMEANDIDTTWWQAVKAGKQDPWIKLRANDINKQMFQYQVDPSTGKVVSK